MNSMIGFGLLNLLIGCFSFWRWKAGKDAVTTGQFRLSFIVSVVIVLAVGISEAYKAYALS